MQFCLQVQLEIVRAVAHARGVECHDRMLPSFAGSVNAAPAPTQRAAGVVTN